MNMDQGKFYSWNPKETGRYCINLFADDNCQDRNGWSCPIWGPRKLGQPWVRSFLVNKEGEELPDPSTKSDKSTSMTSTSSKSESITTSSSTRPTSTGSSAEPSPPSTTSETTTSSTGEPTTGSTTGTTTGTLMETPINTGRPTRRPKHPHAATPVSGGVIAGAVIASIAGVGGLAFFGYFIYRLRKAKAAAPSDSSPDPFAPRPPKNGFQELDSLPASPVTGPQPHAPAASIPTILEAEKAAAGGYGNQHPPMAELPDTSQVWEMDATRHKEQ
ncbi:uncharacterized protein GIQ15_06792 [Arthroderma uncinatum]|uniref:uncharacterized protein n=1 Tax=Arthroderma uncinatum TaxID=74035 RepID=UPI00144A7E01|nr:uncharacterized protein GIQ15_06792 [Arthroderma uncinatum]KAF3479816.1 hypothetical protein GIQ15_06792 [Arthroderma uncinatum]